MFGLCTRKVFEEKTCPLVEARSLIKYKNLSFEYDKGQIFPIYKGNYEFFRNWWPVTKICSDKDAENEPCCLSFIVTIIYDQLQQSEIFKIYMSPPQIPEEICYDP